VKEVEVVNAGSVRGEKRNAYKIFMGTPGRNRPLRYVGG
jgi:hypothetical protein